MSAVTVLFVIDALGALASGSLKDNIYCVDTEGYLGSWGEGTNSLHTICRDGQTIAWRAVGVSAGNDVELTGFSGAMVDSGVCRPRRSGSQEDAVWQGQVQSQGQFAPFAFTASIAIDGRSMAFDGSIKIV